LEYVLAVRRRFVDILSYASDADHNCLHRVNHSLWVVHTCSLKKFVDGDLELGDVDILDKPFLLREALLPHILGGILINCQAERRRTHVAELGLGARIAIPPIPYFCLERLNRLFHLRMSLPSSTALLGEHPHLT
jgi:hypothetical protein